MIRSQARVSRPDRRTILHVRSCFTGEFPLILFRSSSSYLRIVVSNLPAAYWLLADNSSGLGVRADLIGTFVASLKHALLFHDRILLSDSLVVNTPNFRQAIQADPQLRAYLASGCLVIARRKAGDQFLDLIELREKFKANDSRNPGFDSCPRSFLLDDDLRDLQRFASAVPYEPEAAREHYTNSIGSLTADPRFRELSEMMPMLSAPRSYSGSKRKDISTRLFLAYQLIPIHWLRYLRKTYGSGWNRRSSYFRRHSITAPFLR